MLENYIEPKNKKEDHIREIARFTRKFISGGSPAGRKIKMALKSLVVDWLLTPTDAFKVISVHSMAPIFFVDIGMKMNLPGGDGDGRNDIQQ